MEALAKGVDSRETHVSLLFVKMQPKYIIQKQTMTWLHLQKNSCLYSIMATIVRNFSDNLSLKASMSCVKHNSIAL